MTILYAVVCRAKDAAVLAEACDRDIKGSVGPVMVELLQHLRDHPELFADGDMKTFVQRDEDDKLDFFSYFIEACSASIGEATRETVAYYFHLYFKDEVFYCCLADDPDIKDQKVNFAFLENIQKEFTKMHRKGRIRTANAYSLDKNFSPTIRSSMHYHNIHYKELRQEEKVTRLLAQVSNIHDVMGRNLNLMLARGQKFEGILAQSEALNADAAVFRKKSKHAKRVMQRKYYFWYVVSAAIIAFFIYLVTAGICGAGLERCRNSAANGGGGNNQQNGGDQSGENGNNNNNDNDGNDGNNRKNLRLV